MSYPARRSLIFRSVTVAVSYSPTRSHSELGRQTQSCRQFFLKSRSAHRSGFLFFQFGHKDFQRKSDIDAGTVTLVVAVVVLPLESVTST